MKSLLSNQLFGLSKKITAMVSMKISYQHRKVRSFKSSLLLSITNGRLDSLETWTGDYFLSSLFKRTSKPVKKQPEPTSASLSAAS